MRAVWILAVLAWAGCSAGAPGPGVDSAQVLAHVGSLTALGPRPGDSDHARQAARYIEATLARVGVPVERMPVGVVDVPAITVLGSTYRRAHRVETTDPDLIVRFGPPPSSGKALLVMAHYDTVPTSPGAVDNAAAVGVLLELARVLAASPPPIPVILVFTANEEIGLVGAEALAARIGDGVGLALALDLIGGSGALSLNGASELVGASEMRWLARAADRAGVIVRAPLAHRVVSRWWPQAERSDHGAFTRRGIRAFHLYDRGQDGEWIDLAYHREGDVLARVDRASVDELGRLLRALVAEPLPAPGTDGFWVPVLANTVIARWMLIAIELVLAVLALALLFVQRGPLTRGGAGLLAGLGCYVVAIVATVALERGVAGAHVARWLHAPRLFALALALVLAGTFGLLTRLVRRMRPWVGEQRYLALSCALLLTIGSTFVAVGAAELAWIWLVPAAITAIAPMLGRARIVGVLATLLPVVLVLAPNQLREAAWNGFLPIGVPLTVWIAVFGVPVASGGAWYLRSLGEVGPLGALVLPLGCVLAILTGVVSVSHARPGCDAMEFNQFHLACERTPGVR